MDDLVSRAIIEIDLSSQGNFGREWILVAIDVAINRFPERDGTRLAVRKTKRR